MTTTAAKPRRETDDATPQEPASLGRLYIGPLLAVAAVFVAVELAVAARYGFHRDELYFLACARHLAWGYVDQPPLVPFVARISVALFGNSVFGLRLLPAIAGGAAVVITGCMARELGGGRRAQVLGAAAAATSAEVLATVHLLSTATFDLFFWSLLSFLLLRLLRTGNERIWLAIGAVAGLALLNKYNVLFLLAAMAVGLVACGRARMLAGRWLWAGVAIALVIWAPNVIWNAQHDWASVAMLHSLKQENSTLGASIMFIPAQVVIAGPLLLVVWFGGLLRLLRHSFARPLAFAFLTLVVLDVLTGAKPYYLGGIYFVLFAAGGLRIEERIATKGTASVVRRVGAWTLALVVALPLVLPVLPASALPRGPWEGNINKDISATLGWKPFVHQIAAVVATLPPAERAHVVILTGDYGAAGAIDLYGARDGLPHAYSGHNSYWWWGPPTAPDGSTTSTPPPDVPTIAVNLSRSYLATIFASVEPAGAVKTPHDVWSEERGEPIWICRGQRVSWARAWPAARHYG